MKSYLIFAAVVTIVCAALASQAKAAQVVKPKKHYFSNELVEGVKHFENHPLSIGKIKVDKLRIDKYSGKREIGYGFTSDGIRDCIAAGYLPKGYKLPRTMTKAQADKFLVSVMLPTYQKIVKDCVRVKLERKHQEALIMFTYNLGKGSLMMLVNGKNRLNSGNINRTPSIMALYTSAGGKKRVKGLIKRRSYEVNKIWKG
jgi:GH24 family phage-related lysozyme (muramidase)